MMLQGDAPVAGFYLVRLAKGAMQTPVRLWFGPPIVERRKLDRAPRWQAVVDGALTDDVDSIWPFCARWPIDRREYRFRLRRAAWARRHAPLHPAANPRERIDLRNMPPIF